MLTMDASELSPPSPGRDRHVLAAEEELRLEVAFARQFTFKLILQKGSCELFGVELALNREYVFIDGGLKLALFTWYGCVIDVECSDQQHLEICYKAEASETIGNIALVNTHAQLEALRDEAAASGGLGPRVLVVGPTESGKSSCVKILTAYACKLGRTPLLVDLDPNDNMISVPGTLAVCPMNRDAMTIDSYATTGIPPGTASPLVLWHASVQLSSADLFKAQVQALGKKIQQRMQSDDLERSSGIIVNTSGWLQDDGYPVLLETIEALQINVVLVMGHDRLYSLLRSHAEKQQQVGDNDMKPDDKNKLTVVKLPRSGGVVSRNAVYMRQARSRAMKRYFYGGTIDAPEQQKDGAAKLSRVPQLTMSRLHLSFDKVKFFKFSSMSLSASLLPVAAAQTTEPVQIVPVTITEKLQHALIAVCHPQAVDAYEMSGRSRDLYESGVAGFCVVDKVLMDSDMLQLLSPCAGMLPSNVLLLGDVIWMD